MMGWCDEPPERLKFAKEQRKKYPQEPFIHPSVNIPEWVTIGKNVTIHENCIIGAEGCGYALDENGKWLHIPHAGGLVIGDNVEILPGSIIDRGTINDTAIGNGTIIGTMCHIAHNSRIGQDCLLTAKVMVGGSAVIGNNVWVGLHSTILNKVTVGSNIYIGAHTNVIKDVEDGVMIVGNPARVIKKLE